MTVTVDLTPRGLAKNRYDEAARVEDAYSAVVVKRRAAWRNAVPGKDADKARRGLALAVEQKNKAALDKTEAWRAWHALGGPQT